MPKTSGGVLAARISAGSREKKPRGSRGDLRGAAARGLGWARLGATYRARGALNRPDPAEDVVPVGEGGDAGVRARLSREGEKGERSLGQ